MRFLIIGCGLVGREIAAQLKAEGGHVIVGTTTTDAKRSALLEVVDEVCVLKGFEGDKVRAAMQGVDAVAVGAGAILASESTRAFLLVVTRTPLWAAPRFFALSLM